MCQNNTILMQMLKSDWLSHWTLSSISVQWLDVVDFSSFLRSFEGTFTSKQIIKFLRRLKGESLQFL